MKTTYHKDHLEECLPNRLLSGLISIWSSMKITQQYLLNSRNKNRN